MPNPLEQSWTKWATEKESTPQKNTTPSFFNFKGTKQKWMSISTTEYRVQSNITSTSKQFWQKPKICGWALHDPLPLSNLKELWVFQIYRIEKIWTWNNNNIWLQKSNVTLQTNLI